MRKLVHAACPLAGCLDYKEKAHIRGRIVLLLRYLASHPELSELLLAFLASVLEHRLPHEQLLQFAGRFFTQPNLREVVAKKMRDSHRGDDQLAHVSER